MQVSGIHSTGSSLVSVLLTLLAAVPCSMWCPQRGPCIQKKHLVIFSNHTPPASCVFIPTYFIFFLSWQILLCSYRIWSLYLIILFAVFWISYFFFFYTVCRKQDQNCTQFSKQRYRPLQESLYFWSQLGQWCIIMHNVNACFPTLVISLSKSLLVEAVKICLASQIFITERGKGAIGLLA